MRECGLKYLQSAVLGKHHIVTPLAGVWVEIFPNESPITAELSLPLRECGLKLFTSTNS